MTTPPPPPPGGPAFGGPTGALTGRTYANWGYRVLAYIIDVIPLAILNGIGFLLGKPETMTTTTDSGVTITTTSGLGIWYWLFWALGIIYLFWNKAYREGTTTQSLGKSALGMHTVGMQSGQAIGFGTAFGRLLLLYVDFFICYIGVLWPLWDRDRQCLLSDKLTKAVVYKD
ncbi:MAG: RDD family protein [Candidatus Nanopelagicales bacterium]